jgi:hypoxanthine phosphoribosyltransferase
MESEELLSGPKPRVLIDEPELRRRVDELARRLSADYAGAEALLAVGVLRGAFIFMADLVRRIDVPVQIDFVAVSSYRGAATAPGAAQLLLDTRASLHGRHVLIVEDIVDTGHTLAFLRQVMSERQPASLRCCSLLRKRDRHEVDVPVEYSGFDIPDVWVVGYGLDHSERFRSLPYVARIDPAS